MLVALTAAAEIAFWIVLLAGLVLRYPMRRPRLGGWVLLCLPLIDLLLLAAAVADLRRGAEPSGAHGLAALYLGFTVAYGHYTLRWADGHAAHRFGGAPRPPRPPRYGAARARHEWRLWLMTLLATAIALLVLQLLVWLSADGAQAGPLRGWQGRAVAIAGVHGFIALTYTIWPKKAPEGA
ncbi:hypothetical protein [Streptomyces hoynatensis]|uniref:Uncharacterized protein n=1 Tax=Streptomyces hoynatensis TaxID=1141874 RepID=A0A3A9YYZ7_9ACTN|nr:hypothetical protein [Streptomyces hoynatensis]RKN40904.1 hypothetical protein D7294_17700 [Streptomyces hoynatensis]